MISLKQRIWSIAKCCKFLLHIKLQPQLINLQKNQTSISVRPDSRKFEISNVVVIRIHSLENCDLWRMISSFVRILPSPSLIDRLISKIKVNFPGVPIIALTATATPQVQKDICQVYILIMLLNISCIGKQAVNKQYGHCTICILICLY